VEWLTIGTNEAVGIDDGGGWVELSVVGGDEVKAAVDAVEKQEAGAALGVDGGGEPNVIGDVGCGEVEAEALMDIEDEAATNFEVMEKVAFSSHEDAILLVDGDGSDEISEGFFGVIVRFGAGVAGVVENEGGAAVEVDAARVGEGS